MALEPEYIVLHHSLTKDSGTVSWNAIRRYHTQVLGWLDIGYHAGIEAITDGAGLTSYEVIHGRQWDLSGAHCRHGGMNHRSLGVCLVGNFDETPVPLAQWTQASAFVAWLCRHYAIPVSRVVGHRDYNPEKTCPGRLFDLSKFRATVNDIHGRMDLS